MPRSTVRPWPRALRGSTEPVHGVADISAPIVVAAALLFRPFGAGPGRGSAVVPQDSTVGAAGRRGHYRRPAEVDPPPLSRPPGRAPSARTRAFRHKQGTRQTSAQTPNAASPDPASRVDAPATAVVDPEVSGKLSRTAPAMRRRRPRLHTSAQHEPSTQPGPPGRSTLEMWTLLGTWAGTLPSSRTRGVSSSETGASRETWGLPACAS